MTSPSPSVSTGARTAAYLVAGGCATIPGVVVIGLFLGFYGAIGCAVMLWIIGIVWLLKQRQEDPTWDRRPPTARR